MDIMYHNVRFSSLFTDTIITSLLVFYIMMRVKSLSNEGNASIREGLRGKRVESLKEVGHVIVSVLLYEKLITRSKQILNKANFVFK